MQLISINQMWQGYALLKSMIATHLYTRYKFVVIKLLHIDCNICKSLMTHMYGSVSAKFIPEAINLTQV